MIAVAIFMGGSSREREISFAGGRTVYDNLDKNLFLPIPVFIDHEGRLIELRWDYVYKGTIRDFYPPTAYATEQFQCYSDSFNWSDSQWQKPINEIGVQLSWEQLKQKVDLVFLALHGLAGEDGQIQGVLDWYKIPYTGSGLRASAIGMDKSFQKKLMKAAGFETARFFDINRNLFLSYLNQPQLGAAFFAQEVATQIGDFPVVVRPANQGSSIGVQIVKKREDLFAAIQQAFFIQTITSTFWNQLPAIQKRIWLQEFCDIRSQLGFPVRVLATAEVIYQPADLQRYLDNYFSQSDALPQLHLAAHNSEQTVVVESFIEGREFSCVVLQNLDLNPLALPPTEIIKGKEVFDYRAKYLAGLSRKITPINLDTVSIERIREEASRLFSFLGFEVYARIDGFFTPEGKIILNDPNTTSGMLPSSFFFHQAAEIGLNPSEFLTFIIHQSIQARRNSHNQLQASWELLSHKLSDLLSQSQNSAQQRQPVAVLMGGYSSERHISVESGRNVYEKLSSSREYLPIPIFVSKKQPLGLDKKAEHLAHRLHILPIRFLLKDNADDIAQKISDCEQADYQVHPILTLIRQQSESIRQLFAHNNPHFEPRELDYWGLKQLTDLAFIALHGRPGEDGEMQRLLLAHQIGFNGSMPDSAEITIDKFQTLEILRRAGLPTAAQLLVKKADYEQNPNPTIAQIEAIFDYPLIAKPMDDGCSSAVKLLKNTAQMRAYLNLIFRDNEDIDATQADILHLKHKEEFPQKSVALIETLIVKEKAAHFLEITGGLLTHFNSNAECDYLMFEPSETLAGGEILSLEEKFLAGEGQNITPARFTPADKHFQFNHAHISQQVKTQLKQAALALKVTGYARIDAFVRIFEDGKAEVIVIEVNSLPGMTPATCIFHQCAIAGYKPYDFIAAILNFGKIRQQQLSLQPF